MCCENEKEGGVGLCSYIEFSARRYLLGPRERRQGRAPTILILCVWVGVGLVTRDVNIYTYTIYMYAVYMVYGGALKHTKAWLRPPVGLAWSTHYAI